MPLTASLLHVALAPILRDFDYRCAPDHTKVAGVGEQIGELSVDEY